MNGVRRQKRHAASWAGIFVSLAFVLLLLRRFDLSDALRALASANYLYLLPAVFLIPLNFVARAQRWGTLFPSSQRPQLSSSFVALMVGYLANNILPARAGDVVRSYALARKESLPLSTVLATVATERVADLVIVLFMASVLLLFGSLPPWGLRAGRVLAPVALLSLVFLYALRVSGARCMEVLIIPLRFLPDSLFHKIRSFGAEFAGAVASLGRINVIFFLLWTVPVWCCEVLTMFVLSKAFNLPLTLAHALFVILVVGIGTAIPSSPGFVGTYEFFFTGALAAIGVTGGTAFSFAIMVHAVTFVSTNVIGLGCLAFADVGVKGLHWRTGKTDLDIAQ